MIRKIPSSTPCSSSDCSNSGNGSSDNISDRGEEEELGEPNGLAMMPLSQVSGKESKFQGFKMYFKEYS